VTTAALSPLRKQEDVSKDSTAPTAVPPPGSSTPPTATTSHQLGAKISPARRVALCYTTRCTPGSSPYAYKRKDQGPLREGWPRGDEDETDARSLSRVDACNPLLQAHPTWARDGHGGREISTSLTPVSGHLTSPLRARPRVDPSGLGHAATFTRRLRDPRSRNADSNSF
jgi:hypothetical protein